MAFQRVDVDECGYLMYEQLASAFEQVGMAPTDGEIASVVEQLGKSTDDTEEFIFADFAQAADLLSPVE